ncbi:hypothetical protein [Myxosarcina sp. GI1]|uniref:hypothetical protein n=1 Tax=Myxosarcina sp. GI1 TaxID=1541065 RepID=UPI000564452D|nr:hypothetical protein [Myxosarcina sp. GI1]
MRTNPTHHRVEVSEHHDNPIYTVLLVVCSSFVIGAIPVIYGLSLDTASPNHNATTTQLSPWSVLGERD